MTIGVNLDKVPHPHTYNTFLIFACFSVDCSNYWPNGSVADPACLSRILDPSFFPFWIPDPNFFHPGSRIRIKEFKFFNPRKWFVSSRKYDSGCSSRIQILNFYPSRIPDPGVKKAYLVLPSSVLEKTSVAGLPSAPSRSSCSNCSQNPACKYKHIT